jgi:purine-binding chemotaxis protein CheW
MLVFPADAGAAPAGAGKISLPSSGTAEEILARAAASEAVAAAPKAVVPRTAAEPAPAAQPTLSFFTSAQAREEAKAAAVASEHLATFFLEREEYGVDVRLVQEIIRVSEITQVPRAPEFISGVINLRGRVIPVIDLKRKLGLGEFAPARASRIVVVKVRERLIGLLVDGASQVLKVPLSVIEAAPDEVVEIDENFIRGVAKLEGRLIILIDLPKVLQVELRDALPGEPA